LEIILFDIQRDGRVRKFSFWEMAALAWKRDQQDLGDPTDHAGKPRLPAPNRIQRTASAADERT
jgi:hypothetical protein